jgi:DNA-binding HxlR family transcriptional regulator
MTEWGQALCPALDSLLKWSEEKNMNKEGVIQKNMNRVGES